MLEPDEKRFEENLKALAAAQQWMCGVVKKPQNVPNLYRVTSLKDPIRQFDLQRSPTYAGNGNKQSATQASGYVTMGESNTLATDASEGQKVTVYYEEVGNGVDRRNIHLGPSRC